MVRGLSGGVSRTAPAAVGELGEEECRPVGRDWASWVASVTDELPGSLAFCLVDSVLSFTGIERGGPSTFADSSKHVVHGVGRPSVTMRGVGPCRSQ